MTLQNAARYTVSTGEAVAGVALLGIAALHAAAGVPTALLPAIGGVGLLGAAVAVSPPTRNRFRGHASSSEDALLVVSTALVAAVCLLVFTGLGVLF